MSATKEVQKLRRCGQADRQLSRWAQRIWALDGEDVKLMRDTLLEIDKQVARVDESTQSKYSRRGRPLTIRGK